MDYLFDKRFYKASVKERYIQKEVSMNKKSTKLHLVIVPDNPEYMIHVDRGKIPVLPDFAVGWVYPSLQNTGPTDFDLSKLNRVLNLQDGLAIKHKSRLFTKFFEIRHVPMFDSVVIDRFGNEYVPRIYGDRGEVVLEWFHLSYDWREIYDLVAIVESNK